VDEVLPRLLAVADDVDAGVLLLLEREDGGVALGVDQRLAGPPLAGAVGLGVPAAAILDLRVGPAKVRSGSGESRQRKFVFAVAGYGLRLCRGG